jgi:predicted dehydrogenase
MSTQSSRITNRRSFLKQSAIATGAIAAATRSARAKSKGILGANDRIRLGLIGCGGLGTNYHIPKCQEMSRDKTLHVELAAVCDIYEPRKQQAKEKSGCDLYHDYRKMLDRDDIHGVIIATPDHWHAKMTLDAMRAGKDVHVEKPMTLYWEEAKQVHEEAKRLNRVVQVGAEGTSRDCYWQARKIVESGKIGSVVWATGGVYRNVPSGDWNYPIDPRCTPKTLDWDAFLGPAPKRPFDPERYFRYRKYWDYSGGLAHDLLAHILAALQVCIGSEFPHRVSAAGGIYGVKDREVPDTFHMMVEYPSQYVATLFTTQTTEQGIEMAIRGNKGTIRFDRRDKSDREVIVTPEDAYADEFKPFVVGEDPRPEHEVNFVQCMRSRETPVLDAEMGYKSMVTLGLAVRSWREGKMFTFDGTKEKVVS